MYTIRVRMGQEAKTVMLDGLRFEIEDGCVPPLVFLLLLCRCACHLSVSLFTFNCDGIKFVFCMARMRMNNGGGAQNHSFSYRYCDVYRAILEQSYIIYSTTAFKKQRTIT